MRISRERKSNMERDRSVANEGVMYKSRFFLKKEMTLNSLRSPKRCLPYHVKTKYHMI